MPRTLLVLALVLIALSEASAQDGNGTRRLPPAAAYRVAPAGGTIKVDGRLDEAAWKRAEKGSGFGQYDPGRGTPATERTEFAIVYNADHLYVGVWC